MIVSTPSKFSAKSALVSFIPPSEIHVIKFVGSSGGPVTTPLNVLWIETMILRIENVPSTKNTRTN